MEKKKVNSDFVTVELSRDELHEIRICLMKKYCDIDGIIDKYPNSPDSVHLRYYNKFIDRLIDTIATAEHSD